MKYLFIIIVVILFTSCKPEMEDTFPFSQATKIELLSYPVRHEWDSMRQGKKVYLGDLVENKKLVNASGVLERIFINEKQKQVLFDFLFIRKTENCEVASCFEPRHAILFYNDKLEIIANIEICFDCGYDRGSKRFEYNELCYEGLDSIKTVFQDAGIKYYGEGQE